MNKDNASKWIELGSAMLQGKAIQRLNGNVWSDVLNLNTISYDPESFRIKPEPKKGWYRVGLFSHQLGCNPLGIVQCDSEEQRYEECRQFVRWLTDRIEYELPEGE